jgi:hypothetical protein
VRPMLSDRNGWATIIGTPKGKNEFWRVYNDAQKDPDWFHMMLRASDSGVIPKAELEKLKIEQGEDFYAQEYENSFEAAIQGAFYANEMRIMLSMRVAFVRSRLRMVCVSTRLGISAFQTPLRFGSFSAWASNGAWLTTTNLPALVWVTMLMFCTTSAENMVGLTEITSSRTILKFANLRRESRGSIH